MIQFENVGMRYGAGPEVLRDVTFSLPAGSFHFLTGPSGAGKTSLLRLISLSHRPSSGNIYLLDKDIGTLKRSERAALRRKIGVVFQDFRLLDHLSAFDNVALPLRLNGRSETQIQQEVTDLLQWVGLGQHIDARPPALSGGQKQRVAIARAIIARPRFIIADEPTGSVDDQAAFRLLRLFEELYKLGTTVLIATHNQALMTKFEYPRLQLENGFLTQDGMVVVPSSFTNGRLT